MFCFKHSQSLDYIIKNHGRTIQNLQIQIFIDSIENRIIFKIKSGYYLKLLTPETLQLSRLMKMKNRSKCKWKKHTSIRYC